MNKKKDIKIVYKLTIWEKTILILSLATFIFLSILVITDNVKWFDNAIYSFIILFKCDFFTTIFKCITSLCSIEFILVFTVLMLIFSKKRGKIFTFNIMFCVIINQMTKHIFVRSRPIDINLITESGYSFPSGHSMASVAFYGYFIYEVLRSSMDKYKKIIIVSLLVLIILLIGISRIYLGVHYASDVLAGFTLSTAYLIIYNYFMNRNGSY